MGRGEWSKKIRRREGREYMQVKKVEMEVGRGEWSKKMRRREGRGNMQVKKVEMEVGRGEWSKKMRRREGRENMQVKKVEMEEDYYYEEEEEEVMVVKWANHYSSFQEILLVGEGDFSFSLCLANAFGSAANIVATSLDSYGKEDIQTGPKHALGITKMTDILVKKYSRAKSNLKSLKEMGATIVHEVDATKMKFHVYLKMRKFDRIVFNFPHAGFKGKEDNMRLINLHKQLVNGFFKNASHMLRASGEVHVSHKIGGPFCRWNLKELALKSSLILTECANFIIDDYPGYNNKRGDGHRCDHPFPLGECRTFKFRIGNIHEIKRRKDAISTTRANNIRSHDLWAEMSNSPYCPPKFGTRNLHQVLPKAENPLMAGYQRYASEAFRNDVLFRYLENQEEVRNQNNLARRRGLNIENPPRVFYQPYANEAFRDDVLFRYSKNQEEVRNQDNLARLRGLNIENSPRVCYQPYSNEPFLNVHRNIENPPRTGHVLFGYMNCQEEARNQRNLARWWR